MAWCPKCKSEYVDGITVCVDCGCELVEILEEDGAKGDPFSDLMAAAMAKSVNESGTLEELIDPETMQDMEDVSSYGKEPPRKTTGVYVNNEERAEENRTSAYILLFVGGVGLGLITLVFLDVIDFHLSVTSKYMTTGVMGVLFILFIIMGIISMKNAKVLKRKASKENNLTIEIKKWCLENIKADIVDMQMEINDQPEEIKYFQRCEYLKKTIQNQFMNLDEGYLERLIEEVYPEIFGEDGE